MDNYTAQIHRLLQKQRTKKRKGVFKYPGEDNEEDEGSKRRKIVDLEVQGQLKELTHRMRDIQIKMERQEPIESQTR